MKTETHQSNPTLFSSVYNRKKRMFFSIAVVVEIHLSHSHTDGAECILFVFVTVTKRLFLFTSKRALFCLPPILLQIQFDSFV